MFIRILIPIGDVVVFVSFFLSNFDMILDMMTNKTTAKHLDERQNQRSQGIGGMFGESKLLNQGLAVGS